MHASPPSPLTLPARPITAAATRRTTLAALTALLLIGASATRAESDFAQRVRLYLDERTAFPGGEVEVSVGDPDPRLTLAPCVRYEPFIPPGARLIGRTSLGVRCVEGAQWSIYLPVQIRLFMTALVAARPIGRGQAVAAEDVRAERIDVAPLHGNFVPSDEMLLGRTATRAFAAGEPLRRDLLRAPPVLQPGDAVQVIAIGMGFAAKTSGKALSVASEGQTAQVALTNGRVVGGIAKAGGIVEVR